MALSLPVEALIADLRARWPALLAVYLFGSVAQGQAQSHSDVDLAVLLPGKAEPLALWEVSQDLARMLGRDVDLLDLRAASTVMQYQVLTTGRRLWAADVQAGLFECFVFSEKTALDEARADLLADVSRRGRVYG